MSNGKTPNDERSEGHNRELPARQRRGCRFPPACLPGTPLQLVQARNHAATGTGKGEAPGSGHSTARASQRPTSGRGQARSRWFTMARGMAQPNDLLRYERELRGWTLEDVASGLHAEAARAGGAEIAADAGSVGRWERGTRKPSARAVQLLCRLHGKTADEHGFQRRPGI